MQNEPITAPRNNNQETVIYSQNGIQVTNLRAVFGSKTYAISNITSVDSSINQSSGCVPFALIGISIISFWIGISSYTNNWSADNNPIAIVLGILFAIGGFGLFKTAKPSYSVNITTAAGDVRAFTSDDETEIKNIVEGLNKAIIQKG